MATKSEPNNQLSLWFAIAVILAISLPPYVLPAELSVKYHQLHQLLYFPFLVFGGGLVPSLSVLLFVVGVPLVFLRRRTAWIPFCLGAIFHVGYWLYATAENAASQPTSYHSLHVFKTYLFKAFWPVAMSALVSYVVYRFCRSIPALTNPPLDTDAPPSGGAPVS